MTHDLFSPKWAISKIAVKKHDFVFEFQNEQFIPNQSKLLVDVSPPKVCEKARFWQKNLFSPKWNISYAKYVESLPNAVEKIDFWKFLNIFVEENYHKVKLKLKMTIYLYDVFGLKFSGASRRTKKKESFSQHFWVKLKIKKMKKKNNNQSLFISFVHFYQQMNFKWVNRSNF